MQIPSMTYLNPENFSMSSLNKKNGFYVNIPKLKKNDGKTAAVNQIIRYADRHVMTESRIIDYDYSSEIIHNDYEDHTTKERIEPFNTDSL